MLNLRTALPDARVEVYDASGRHVHCKSITENVTAIDTEAWAKPVHSLNAKKQAEAKS